MVNKMKPKVNSHGKFESMDKTESEEFIAKRNSDDFSDDVVGEDGEGRKKEMRNGSSGTNKINLIKSRLVEINGNVEEKETKKEDNSSNGDQKKEEDKKDESEGSKREENEKKRTEMDGKKEELIKELTLVNTNTGKRYRHRPVQTSSRKVVKKTDGKRCRDTQTAVCKSASQQTSHDTSTQMTGGMHACIYDG